MNTDIIRQQLHSFLEIAEDKKVQAIYAIMENEIKENITEYSDEFKRKLDLRYSNYRNNELKAVTASESKERIGQILKAK